MQERDKMTHQPGRDAVLAELTSICDAWELANGFAHADRFSSPDEPPTASSSSAPRSQLPRSSANHCIEGVTMIQLAPARARLPDSTSDIAIEDCELLLNAVKAMLSRTVGECCIPTSTLPATDTAARTHASMLECVAALDHLHTTLANELGRRQRQDLATFDIQNTLAQVRSELVIAVRCSLCTAHPASGTPPGLV
jgi:hypothetical protein